MKIFIDWNDFHKDVKNLASLLKSGNYNKIVAVSRGGFIPAGILAYELDIRNCSAINVSSYDGDEQRTEKEISVSGNPGVVDEHTLIIDDLSDTGTTFKTLRNIYPKAKYVAVYAKPKGKYAVDTFVKEMPDEWLVFPWDL